MHKLKQIPYVQLKLIFLVIICFSIPNDTNQYVLIEIGVFSVAIPHWTIKVEAMSY